LNYMGLEFRRKFWAGDMNFGVPAM